MESSITMTMTQVTQVPQELYKKYNKVVEGVTVQQLQDMHDKIDAEIDRLVEDGLNRKGYDIALVSVALFNEMVDPLSKKSVNDILINPEKSEQIYRDMYMCDSLGWDEYQKWINHIIKMGDANVLDLIWRAVYCDRANPDFESDYKYACEHGSYDTFVKTMEGLFWSTLDGFENLIFVDDIIEKTKNNKHIDQQHIKELFDKYEKVVIEQKMILGIPLLFKEWGDVSAQFNEDNSSVSEEWQKIMSDSINMCEGEDQYDNYRNGYNTVKNVFRSR